MEASMSPEADVYDLGDLGHLVTIRSPSATSLRDAGVVVAKRKPLVVAIVDRSGSMGQWVQRAINNSLPAALTRLGYEAQDRVVVITFDSIAERVRSGTQAQDPTVAELAKVSAACRGSTNMTGAVKLLGTVLAECSDESVSMIVISDGAVGDKDATVREAEQVGAKLRGRSAPISVALLQMLTSTSADPDTRAMTCIGSLNSAGKVNIIEVHTSASKASMTVEEAISGITDSIATSLGTNATEQVVLALPGPAAMHRVPGDMPIAQLSMGLGRTVTILIDKKADLEKLTLAGQPVTLKFQGALKDEASAAPFLEFVESQLRVWAVMGARKEDAKAILDWMQKLQVTLEATAVSEVNTQVDSSSLRTRDRARALLARIGSRKKSAVSRILELGNAEKLSQLNSKQQADFLRGAQGAQGVAVAKRAAKLDADMDYDELARSALRALAQSPSSSSTSSSTIIKNSEEEEVSFYSRDSFADILSAARELSGEVEILNAIDVLPLIGGVGVPFRAYQGAYADPWAFQVIEVYASTRLSENDLRTAVIQAQGEAVLQCPGMGRDAPITGVMPLSLADPSAYATYTRGPLRPIAELQASVSLRGMIARVPYDVLARNSAVLVNLCQQIGPFGAIPEYLDRLLRDVHATVSADCVGYAQGVFADLVKDLATEDPRPYLTGDRNISGTLKPFTALLNVPTLRSLLKDSVQRGRILRALFALDAYIAARRAFRDGGRDVALHALLGIDLVRSRVPLKPLFEIDEEPNWDRLSEQQLDLAKVAERAQALTWLPSPQAHLAMLRFALSDNGAPLSAADSSTYFGLQGDLQSALLAPCAVYAISQANESDRVDTATRKALTPDPEDTAGVVQFMRGLVKSAHKRDWDAHMSIKKAEEARLKLVRLVDDLLAAPTSSAFLSLLAGPSGISNRSAPGYNDLESALMNVGRECPDRLGKLEILLLGRDDGGIPIWANGNVLIGDLKRFAELFKELDASGQRWAHVEEIRKKYGIYKYGRNGQNRHSHGNDKPSFFALGYASLDKMKASVSAADFDAYLKLHVDCCSAFSRHPKK